MASLRAPPLLRTAKGPWKLFTAYQMGIYKVLRYQRDTSGAGAIFNTLVLFSKRWCKKENIRKNGQLCGVDMVNVWDYANQLPYVTVKTVDGRVFSGGIICVMDTEETDYGEDSLTIESRDGDITTFLQSQIEQVIVHEGGPRGK